MLESCSGAARRAGCRWETAGWDIGKASGERGSGLERVAMKMGGSRIENLEEVEFDKAGRWMRVRF